MSRLFFVLSAILVSACGAPSEQSPDSAPPPAAADVAEEPRVVPADSSAAALDASTLAGLAAADAKDGATDQVVSKCAGCSLMMDGKAEHSLSAGEYTLHLCSSSCRDHFSKDMDASLRGLVAQVAPTPEESPAAD